MKSDQTNYKTVIYTNDDIDSLYQNSIKSTRTGKTFNAHNYPTKINPYAILPFILVHTKPHDIIFDGFSGSGSTGIATVLAEKQFEVNKINIAQSIKNQWGPRNCYLYDISELASFVSDTIINPPDPDEFRNAAEGVLITLKKKWGWMYEAQNDNELGNIRYTIWTEHIVCPKCSHPFSFWDNAVVQNPPTILTRFHCPKCGSLVPISGAPREIENHYDDLLNKMVKRRKRSPAIVYGKTGKTYWKRPINDQDLELIEKINEIKIPANVPIIPMMEKENEKWGELHRRGYHFGITHLHHFYTRRNLILLASAFELAESYPDDVKKGLKLWISSYNSSHSTLMTRVVCKKKSKDLVVTSSQPGVLYISNLPVEKNIISGLSEKLNPINEAFREMRGHQGEVHVKCHSSLDVELGDSTVDYIFTDPPFGDNIQYSEVNFIDEAWLGTITHSDDEAIVSKYQGKLEDDYQNKITKAFKEFNRILKPNHYMTLIFHSSKAKIWDTIFESINSSGFQIETISTLDKVQGSFKQTTTKGFVKGDAVILLRKTTSANNGNGALNVQHDLIEIIQKRLSDLPDDDIKNRTRQNLYNYVIKIFLEKGQKVPIDAKRFYMMLSNYFDIDGNLYRVRRKEKNS